jgi:hypothetical protein
MGQENFNVGRVLTDGKINRLNTTAQKKSAEAPTLHEAVVYEVFNDPELLTNDQKEELKNLVSNPEHIDWMPMNSIMAKIVSSGQNQTDDSPVILFPFFQSHFLLPIQAGEKVLVIYEDYQFKGTSLGRWITRPAEPHTVEDANFTHGDRKLDPINSKSTTELAQKNRNNVSGPNATIQNERPNFPNGAGYDGATTLVQQRSSQANTQNPFDKIYKESTASKIHTYESVPRWIKRPQEFVLQGMNNSVIVLGQDRIGPAVRENNSKEKKKFSGTIDMVVGRGRNPLQESDNVSSATGVKKTSPLVVRNSRGDVETDKTPYVRNKTRNPNEGNPDFQNDAARIYLTMNSEADTNFKLKSGEGITYPDNSLKVVQPSAPSEQVGTSYLIGKADHLRFIARKSENPTINGTVLIVKEGTKNRDLAYIYITKDGRIQIEGPQIFLGNSTNGSEEPPLDNPEAGPQPYIRYQEYKATIEHLQSQIDTLKNYLQQTIGGIVAGAMTAAVSVPFAPVASLTAAGPQALGQTTAMASDISAKSGQTPQKILNCRSKTIFGE